MTANSKNKKIKRLSLAAVLILLFVIGLFFWTQQRSGSENENTPTPSSTQSDAVNSDSEDLSPAKQEILDDQAKTPAQAGSKSVTPLITFAEHTGANVEVIAFVPGVSEEGGSCVLTVTQGSASITETVSATQNASTTDCRRFVIPRSQFTSTGDWEVRVSYNSASASGTSDPWQLTIK